MPLIQLNDLHNIRGVSAICCGESIRSPGLAVECMKCHTVFQIRLSPTGNLMMTTTPHRMPPKRRPRAWWMRVLARVPFVGRWFE